MSNKRDAAKPSDEEASVKSWKELENEVRTVASMTWQITFHSEQVHGRQIDAYAQLNAKEAVAIEVTEKKT